MYWNRFGPRFESMALKSKALSELGFVVLHNNGWRARVKFSKDCIVEGPTHYGSDSRSKAEADLAQVRQAPTRDEMQCRLKNLTQSPPAASTDRPTKRLRAKTRLSYQASDQASGSGGGDQARSYYEIQHRGWCGKHAINNFLGGDFVTQKFVNPVYK